MALVEPFFKHSVMECLNIEGMKVVIDWGSCVNGRRTKLHRSTAWAIPVRDPANPDLRTKEPIIPTGNREAVVIP